MDFGQGLGRYRLAERSKLAELRGENSGPTDLHRSHAATTLRGFDNPRVPSWLGRGEDYDIGVVWDQKKFVRQDSVIRQMWERCNVIAVTSVKEIRDEFARFHEPQTAQTTT